MRTWGNGCGDVRGGRGLRNGGGDVESSASWIPFIFSLHCPYLCRPYLCRSWPETPITTQAAPPPGPYQLLHDGNLQRVRIGRDGRTDLVESRSSGRRWGFRRRHRRQRPLVVVVDQVGRRPALRGDPPRVKGPQQPQALAAPAPDRPHAQGRSARTEGKSDSSCHHARCTSGHKGALWSPGAAQ
jgi:hypothetical protein